MSAGDLSAELERLPGVLAATVFDDSRTGARVYLATSADADRDVLRGAVAGLLRDRGLQADAERIHIAAPAIFTSHGEVLRSFWLEGVDVHRVAGRAECTVRLRTASRTTEGTSREPDTGPGRIRAAARAALQAAEGLEPDLRLGLHGVRESELFGDRAIAVLVEASAGRARAHLPGIALIGASPEEAAALAVASALRGWRY